MGASEVWFLCLGRLHLWTEISSQNKLADPLGIEILELLKGVVRVTNNRH